MPIQVQTPDGNIAQFPDGMSDDAISAVLAKEFPAPKAAPVKPPANTYADVIKSAASGLGQGVAAVVGLPGDIGKGVQYVGDKIVGYFDPDSVAKMQAQRQAQPDPLGLPTSSGVNRTIEAATGGYHQPETTPGQYARTIASFAPASLAPGGIATRVSRVVIPGAASETGGEIGDTISPEAGTIGRVAGAVAGGITPSIASAGMRLANKATDALTGSGFLNPNVEAARRLSSAFAADGGLDSALDRNASFTSSGASAPTVLDLGGGNVRRLVRAAAGGGDEAHNVATTYADRVRANLQDNVINRANQLTPGDARTAGQAATDLERGQDALATEQYREPYSQPAAVNDDLVSALEGPEGRRVINAAYSDASANRDHRLMAELDGLRQVAADQGPGEHGSLRDALSFLSAEALDRVRIATRETARGLAQAGRNYRARGYFGRMGDIDTALDQTPGLTDARASYRQMQASRDALDAGATVLSSPSANYAAQITDLASRGGPPNLRPLQIGARQAITDAVEAPAAGQTGVLTKLATGNRATANLANTFGADRAAAFQEAVRNEVSRLRNANFISPETGSQTQLRGADEALVGGIPTSIGSFVSKIADKIFRGTQLTAAEREAIVRLGTSEADVRRFATQRPSPLARTAAPAALINASRAEQQ
jgi:hypothetical protein